MRRRAVVFSGGVVLTVILLAPLAAWAIGGALSQLGGTSGCVSEDGWGGECADGKALDSAGAVAVSPDGRNVYVASFLSDAVAAFDRDVPSYDIDGDGQLDPLTDGLLLLRFLFGFTGAPLVAGAVDLVNCTRCTALEIEAYGGMAIANLVRKDSGELADCGKRFALRELVERPAQLRRHGIERARHAPQVVIAIGAHDVPEISARNRVSPLR